MWDTGRRFAVGVLAAIVGAGCAPQQPSVPPEVTTATVGSLDPNRIKRVRADLPPGYEVTDAAGVTAPAAAWGFRDGWNAVPPQCARLADPGGGAQAQGFSGSGDGGLVYVVVATAPGMGLGEVGDCNQWVMSYGRSSATVSLLEAPPIDGADTVGMAADIRTVVESGTETDSRAQTFTAYLGEHYVFVALIVDPGSPHPPLPAQFAADLLVKSVAALRG